MRGGAQLRLGQRPAVELAVGVSGSAPAPRSPTAPCTPAAAARAQPAAPRCRAPPRRRPPHRRPAAGSPPVRPRDTAACARPLRGQHRLDLAQLDPEAAHLHLVVGPAENSSCRPPATGPGRRSGTSAAPAGAEAGRPRTAPPSARHGQISPGQTRARRCTARRPTRGTGSSPPSSTYIRCSPSAGRSARCRADSAGTSMRVASTVVSVGPYRLVQPRGPEMPRDLGASSAVSASPPNAR